MKPFDITLPEGNLRSTFLPSGKKLFLRYRNGWYHIETRWGEHFKRTQCFDEAIDFFEKAEMEL